VDIDEDGHLDILSGSYSRMEGTMAGLFHVLRGRSDGTFSPAEVLKGTDGEPLIIPAKEENITEKICTRPFAVDWDMDGHLDLVVGNFSGTFYLFRGRGKGQFEPKPEPMKAGDSPLRIKGAHSDPFVVDWDRDGDFDILSGSSEGGVQWAENTAGKGKPPELKPFRSLIAPGPSREYGTPLGESDLTGPARATRVWVADVDADGKLDILVGDSITLISIAKGITEEEYRKQFAKWQKDFNAAGEALNNARNKKDGDKEDAETIKKLSAEYSKMYQQKDKFMKEEMTGFVWIYRQK
jgi:hypothetical protein